MTLPRNNIDPNIIVEENSNQSKNFELNQDLTLKALQNVEYSIKNILNVQDNFLGINQFNPKINLNCIIAEEQNQFIPPSNNQQENNLKFNDQNKIMNFKQEFENDLKTIFQSNEYMIKSHFPDINGNDINKKFDDFFKAIVLVQNSNHFSEIEIVKTSKLTIPENALLLLNKFQSFRFILEYQNLFHSIIVLALIKIIGSPILESNEKANILNNIIPNYYFSMDELQEEVNFDYDIMLRILPKIINLAYRIYQKYFHGGSNLIYHFKQLIVFIFTILKEKIIIHFYDNSNPFTFNDSNYRDYCELFEIFILSNMILVMPYPKRIRSNYPIIQLFNKSNIFSIEPSYPELEENFKQYILVL